MEEDDDLIRTAMLWATGATIHDVKGLIGHYRAAVWLINRPGVTPEQIAMGTEIAAREARTLREFMRHGDYRRARRENPPPGGWTGGTYG